MSTATCTIGGYKIDLQRVKDYHYAEDGNFVIIFADKSAITLSGDLAGDFLAHWNNYRLNESSLPPGAP